MLVLLPLELLLMFFMNRYNKKKNHALAWKQEDAGAVDLTPWKYRWVATALIIICIIAVYAAFSPIGIGTWGYAQAW